MNDSQARRLRDRNAGPATLISEGCKISGLITGDGDFQISGQIDGDCDLEGTVTLSRNGFWAGTIKAGNVVVAGHVEGDIVARGKVEITDTAPFRLNTGAKIKNICPTPTISWVS